MQDYDPTGVDSGAVGTLTYNDSTAITLAAQSIKISNIDPNDFRDIFEPLGLPAEMLYTFPDLPAEIQTAFMLEILENVSLIIDKNVWTGSTASGVAQPTNRFNGWLTALDTAGDYVDATTSGATAFSASNIFTYMDEVKSTLYSNTTMLAVESRRRDELKCFVSKNTANFLVTAEQNTSGKGETRLTSSGIYDLVYSGAFPVVPLASFPDDQILVTYASTDPRRSNLQYGATNTRDAENVQVFRMSNGSNYIGVRMDMSLGAQVAYSNETLRFVVP